MKHDCLILLFALFLSYGTSSVIVTPRAVVAGIGYNYNWNTNNYDKWFLEERSINSENPPDYYAWTISSDPRFPYGVFIESVEWPGLVWDVKGYFANPNAPVGLYQKKSTTVETKNQRWVRTSNGEFASVINETMVIKVNATGHLVMGQKIASNPQKLWTAELGYLEFKNNRRSEVYATSVTPFGWGIERTIAAYSSEYEWMTQYLQAFENSTIYLKDYQGKVLAPSPIKYTSSGQQYYTLSESPAIPIGTFTFSGQWSGTSTMTATISKDSSGRGQLSGRGKDASGRKFALTAGFADYQLLSFSKVYDDNGETFWRHDGAVSYNPFTISGTYESSAGFGSWFSYTKN